MTPVEKRKLKKEGKLIVEKRSAALHQAFAPDLSTQALWNKRANEQWLREHRERIPAAEVSKRFVVTPAETLGFSNPFVECLTCHDVLHSYPRESSQCSCGRLTVTFRKPRRGYPPEVSARDDQARTVVLTAKG